MLFISSDLGCADGFKVDLLFHVLAVQAVADVPEGWLLVHLGGCHEFDELTRGHLFHVPIGVHLFESLIELRKNRKDLLECGLIGTLVHADLPYI
jgi:hypothetical protein